MALLLSQLPGLITPVHVDPRLGLCSTSLVSWRSFLWTMALVSGVFVVAFLLRREHRLSPDPLSNVPAHALAVARVDMPALRRTQLVPVALSVIVPGATLRSAQDDCGFDPLEGIHELLLWIGERPDGRPDEVGMIVRGNFDAKRLGQCLVRVAGEQGVPLERRELEGLPVLQRPGSSAVLAFVQEGALVWATPASLRAVLRAASGEARSLAQDANTVAAWKELSLGAIFAGLGRLPSGWRSASSGEPTIVGLSLDGIEKFGGAFVGDRLRLVAFCRDETTARRLGETVERFRTSPQAKLLAMSTGLGPWLEAAAVETDGRRVALDARFDAAVLRALAEARRGVLMMVPQAASSNRDPDDRAADPSSGASPIDPDEVLRAP